MAKGDTPAWICRRLNQLRIVRRRSTVCECGSTCGLDDIKGDERCAPLPVATCPTCGFQWGIIL